MRILPLLTRPGETSQISWRYLRRYPSVVALSSTILQCRKRTNAYTICILAFKNGMKFSQDRRKSYSGSACPQRSCSIHGAETDRAVFALLIVIEIKTNQEQCMPTHCLRPRFSAKKRTEAFPSPSPGAASSISPMFSCQPLHVTNAGR